MVPYGKAGGDGKVEFPPVARPSFSMPLAAVRGGPDREFTTGERNGPPVPECGASGLPVPVLFLLNGVNEPETPTRRLSPLARLISGDGG